MKIKDFSHEYCNCPDCGEKLVDMPHVPSALDDVVCPKCGVHALEGVIGFYIPNAVGSVVVDCRCDRCGHEWAVRVVLPKNFFG